MRDWLPYRESFLSMLIESEAPKGARECAGCSAQWSPWRCVDCLDCPSLCTACCLHRHRYDFLHRIERWTPAGAHKPPEASGLGEECVSGPGEASGNIEAREGEPSEDECEGGEPEGESEEGEPDEGESEGSGDDITPAPIPEGAIPSGEGEFLSITFVLHASEATSGFYQRSTLTAAGLPIWIGHSGEHCPNASFSTSETLTVVDITGLHFLRVFWCQCVQSWDRAHQLLQMRLYPASVQAPRTAFTFRVLDDFLLSNKISGCPANSYYDRLRRLTNPTFPRKVPVSKLILNDVRFPVTFCTGPLSGAAAH